MNTVNWAIIAPGNIADKFATALQGAANAVPYSVASRTPEKAAAFANKHSFEAYADSYDELINDPKVDAIYIASPHMLHAEQSMACLKAAKAVLCEKPMSVNSHDAQKVVSMARQQNTFFMEAVWTRFMPVHKKIQEWIQTGRVGEVQMVQASFGFAREFTATHRLFDPQLAGGALLDIGIYPITMAQIALGGMPSKISALAALGQSGVDENLAMLLHYPQGQIATLNATLKANTSWDAWIFGSEGCIHIPLFWFAQSATLFTGSMPALKEIEKCTYPHKVNGYEYEIEEVHRCLDQGLLESPHMSWQESIRVLNIMDEVRSQIGLSYPFETAAKQI